MPKTSVKAKTAQAVFKKTSVKAKAPAKPSKPKTAVRAK